MDKYQPNPDPEPSPAPRPDRGELTHPHGDGLDQSHRGDDAVNAQRNMSGDQTSAADPDNDRPAD